MHLPYRSLVLAGVVGVITACGASDSAAPPTSQFTTRNESVALNPSGWSPLTANIHVETSTPTSIAMRVAGKNGTVSDVNATFPTVESIHEIRVYGLYPASTNSVELIFSDASGSEVGRRTYSITTGALPVNTFPQIAINTRVDGAVVPGMTLVSYFGYGTVSYPSRPFIFDQFGDIRWYLDYTEHPQLKNLFFDDGIERLRNGNFYFGDIASNAIYEVNMLGLVENSWPIPGYQFHHQVLEKPDGNFLVTVSRQGANTTEDVIIELGRTSKQVVRTWDLRTSLQYGRRTLTSDGTDWIHVNAVEYDASDNSIIISGRTQGVVKLDENNHVVWILGPHRGWGTAGDGTDLRTRLLQPVDPVGEPITDPAVLDGSASDAFFEWNWYQHAPMLMPNGHVLLFDNGDNRNFGASPSYSRAVEYAIDPGEMTVRQVWAYGKGRGSETYSRIVSDVDYHPAQDHVIFSPGAIGGAKNVGKAIEIDHATQHVVFEATLTPPQALFGITFHRTERLSLYP